MRSVRSMIMVTSPVRKITIMKELKMENQWICEFSRGKQGKETDPTG